MPASSSCTCWRGSFQATINGKGMTVREGEMLVTNCYSVHAYSAQSCLSITSVIPLSVVPSMRKLLSSHRFRENIVADDERRTFVFLMRTLVENPSNEIAQKGLSYALLGLFGGAHSAGPDRRVGSGERHLRDTQLPERELLPPPDGRTRRLALRLQPQPLFAPVQEHSSATACRNT